MSFSLTHLRVLQRGVMNARLFVYRSVWHMTIHETAHVSLKANLDRTYPRGVHIGAHSWIAFDAVILTHDRTRGLYLDTVVGENCFIGGRSILMPGVTVGDGSVVGAGAVVTKDVPPGCAVAGNPAVVVRRDLEVGPYGRYVTADATTHDLKARGLVRG